jgi:hypothetical protein
MELSLPDRLPRPGTQGGCAADHFPFAGEGFRVRGDGNGSYRSV